MYPGEKGFRERTAQRYCSFVMVYLLMVTDELQEDVRTTRIGTGNASMHNSKADKAFNSLLAVYFKFYSLDQLGAVKCVTKEKQKY